MATKNINTPITKNDRSFFMLQLKNGKVIYNKEEHNNPQLLHLQLKDLAEKGNYILIPNLPNQDIKEHIIRFFVRFK